MHMQLGNNCFDSAVYVAQIWVVAGRQAIELGDQAIGSDVGHARARMFLTDCADQDPPRSVSAPFLSLSSAAMPRSEMTPRLRIRSMIGRMISA